MTAPPDTRERLALALLCLAAPAVVLIALPFKTFDLDRFFVPKELVLHVAALGSTLLLARWKAPAPRRVTTIELLLAVFLGLTAFSAVFAVNGWLAWRAVALTASGILLFLAASTMRARGRSNAIVASVAVAVVLGALSSLIQAYAGPVTELFSLNRAPGGTFGNRNFMAHLAAIGAPVIVIAALRARRRAPLMGALVGVVILGAALILSRSRAAWLSLAAAGASMAIGGLLLMPRYAETHIRRRLAVIGITAVLSAVAAAYVPNRLEWRSASPYLESVRDVVNYQEGSGKGRLKQYTNSLGMVADDPILGVSPGNWPVAYPKYASRRDPSLAIDGGMTDNPWPSSDWVAFITERGVLATASLAGALLLLLWGALQSLRRSRATSDSVAAASALMLIGTLIGVIVVGTFDAALLLAVPTTVAWLLAGALAAPHEGRIAIGARVYRSAMLTLVTVSLVGLLGSGLQWGAMSLANGTTRASRLATAARVFPGSYKIRVSAAHAALGRGDCASVRRHARAAQSMFPSATEPKALLNRCR